MVTMSAAPEHLGVSPMFSELCFAVITGTVGRSHPPTDMRPRRNEFAQEHPLGALYYDPNTKVSGTLTRPHSVGKQKRFPPSCGYPYETPL